MTEVKGDSTSTEPATTATAPTTTEPDVEIFDKRASIATGKTDGRESISLHTDLAEEKKDTISEHDLSTKSPTSPSEPRSRNLTRHLSQSTVASVSINDPMPSDTESFKSVDNRISQASTAPTISSGKGSARTTDGAADQIKSPLSQRRISVSSLDEVSLMDDLPSTPSIKDAEAPPAVAAAATPMAPAETKPASPPPAPAASLVSSFASRFSRGSNETAPAVTKPATITRKLSSPLLSSPFSLPSLGSKDSSKDTTIDSASTTSAPPPPAPTPSPAPRRSPFSWLRSSTSSVIAPATPAAASKPGSRRATASSTASGVEDQLGALRTAETERELAEKNHEKLKAKFKDIRMEKTAVKENGDEDAENKLEDSEKPTARPGRSNSIMAAMTRMIGEPAPEFAPKVEEVPIDWDFWEAVVNDAAKVYAERPEELNQAVQAGIPPTLRGVVWQSLSDSKSSELEAIYREVIALPADATAEQARPLFGSYWLWDPSPTPSSASSPRVTPAMTPKSDTRFTGLEKEMQWGKTVSQLEKVIKRDLGDRTSFGKYKADQKALLNVCKAYALFDPAVGYTQGMTFIVTVLLLNMPEEEAFCVFVKLMNKYRMRTMFRDGMKGLELRLYQYDRILEDFEPRLAIHLKRQHIESNLYAAQWFLTLFTYKFPLQLVLRVFDLLFTEGLEAPILQFGIVLMHKNATQLLEMEFDTLGPFLKERLFDAYIDAQPSPDSVKQASFFGTGGENELYRANDLIADACSIKITTETLERYATEWEEIERQKEATEKEIAHLKSSNASLARKVKRLETENEELSRDYLRIANSEVALKVQNEKLEDENESLKGKVDGLRDMVDKQPDEIEAKYKSEMEQLIQKSLIVHRENQTLEENMLEMEKELVSTKMELATVNEEHDMLKNRWHDLRKALGD